MINKTADFNIEQPRRNTSELVGVSVDFVPGADVVNLPSVRRATQEILDDSFNPSPYFNRGRLYLDRAAYRLAIADFSAALERIPFRAADASTTTGASPIIICKNTRKLLKIIPPHWNSNQPKAISGATGP